jgi:hypothetical protein
VSFGIGEGTKTFVVFLAGSVPQGKLYRLAIDTAVCNVVFKDGRYLWK